MKNEIETIKTSKDGSKLMKYNGTEFWVNARGGIAQTHNWGVCDELLSAGLVTRKFYKHLFGAEEFILK